MFNVAVLTRYQKKSNHSREVSNLGSEEGVTKKFEQT